MHLVIATRNPGKVAEIQRVFASLSCTFATAADFPDVPATIEDGDTLGANAIKKARELAEATGFWSLSDDTGLEVAALDGAPGVYSARYAGPAEDPAANCAKLLDALQAVTDRAARFRTVLALVSPDGEVRTVDGVCTGQIRTTLSGGGGFGYDPLFVPDGETRCFAAMSTDEKNAISHRGRALRAACAAWRDVLGR